MNRKFFIDTNVFIRLLVPENRLQHQTSKQIITLIEKGKISPYISTIVIHELLFTLLKIYKFPKTKILQAISKILSLRNLSIIEKTNLIKALTLFRTLNIKFGDCLIATQLPEGTILCSFDEELKKIKGLNLISPEDLVAKYSQND